MRLHAKRINLSEALFIFILILSLYNISKTFLIKHCYQKYLHMSPTVSYTLIYWVRSIIPRKLKLNKWNSGGGTSNNILPMLSIIKGLSISSPYGSILFIYLIAFILWTKRFVAQRNMKNRLDFIILDRSIVNRHC